MFCCPRVEIIKKPFTTAWISPSKSGKTWDYPNIIHIKTRHYLLGHLGGSVGWATNSWFLLRSWFHKRNPTSGSVLTIQRSQLGILCLPLSLSLPGSCSLSLKININKLKKKKLDYFLTLQTLVLWNPSATRFLVKLIKENFLCLPWK